MSSLVIDDYVDADRASALAGLLDRSEGMILGDRLPLMWHLAYFLPRPSQSELGVDGHPLNGYPAAPQPGLRRMFAGGRVTMRPGLCLGDHAQARTKIVSSSTKQGRAGALTFLTTRTGVFVGGSEVLTDERDIVYLPQTTGPSVVTPDTAGIPSTVPAATVSRNIDVGPTLLFRFSALTYNAHRIHYDRDYAQHTEKYPGLVVHGPLQAVLMAGLAEELLGASPLSMSYRLVAPLFEGQGLVVGAQPGSDGSVLVEVTDASGGPTATAAVSTTFW